MKEIKLSVLLSCITLLLGGGVACGLGVPETPTPAGKAVVIPTLAATIPALPLPSPAGVTPAPEARLVALPDGSAFPLPADAEEVPVVEGVYIGFTTGLSEPELFDFYAAWLGQHGWQQQAPTEAMITPPRQRWRKGDLELLIELQPPDEGGHTVAWVQVSTLSHPTPTSAWDTPPQGAPWTNYTNGNEVLALAAGEGIVWAGTRGGAVRWEVAGGRYTKYTRDHGLASNEVSAIAVAAGGRAWFGTTAGVSRYDGAQWVTYPTVEAAIEADYANILSTVSGRGLWVVQPPDKVWLASGPVKVYDGHQWRTYTTADGLPEDKHRVTAVGPDGRVWVGTWYHGLSVFDGQQWTTYNYSNTGYRGPSSGVGLAGDTITALAVDAAGTVWVGVEMDRMAQYGGLSRFDGREWRTYPDLLGVGTGRRHRAIRNIVPDGRGGVWLDTKHGVSHFDGQQWTHLAGEQSQPGGEVQALLVDTAGTVWVGTGRGLARFDGTGWRAFRTYDGPAANEVRAVAVDDAGRVWFGTPHGLSVFDGANWHTYTQADGLAADAISALAVDGDGRVWAGTAWWTTGDYVPEPTGAGVSVFDGTSWRTFTRADGLASEIVTAIAVDRAGRVWVGGEQAGPAGGRGVSVFDGANWRVYTTDDGLAYDSVSALAVDAAGQVWIGGYSPAYGGAAGVSVFDGTGFRRYTAADGLASDEVTAIAADAAGNVWVGTKENGVSRWDGQTWTTYVAGDGLNSPATPVTAVDAELPTSPYPARASRLASNHVTALAVDAAGQVWVGTWESGLSVFTLAGTGDGTAFRTFTTADGLVDDRIRAIAAGADGSLWVGTAGGVSRLLPALLLLAPQPTSTPPPG